MRDDNELGLSPLNEGGNLAETVLYSLGLSLGLGLSSASSDGCQASLLLGLGLGTIFIEEGEESLGCEL